MKAMQIIRIVKNKLELMCVIFTFMTMGLSMICFFILNMDMLTPQALFFNLAYALCMSAATLVFRLNLKYLNRAAQHVLFFVLLYIISIIFAGIIYSNVLTPAGFIAVSIVFIIVYGIIMGIRMLIKTITGSWKNKTEEYQKLFK